MGAQKRLMFKLQWSPEHFGVPVLYDELQGHLWSRASTILGERLHLLWGNCPSSLVQPRKLWMFSKEGGQERLWIWVCMEDMGQVGERDTLIRIYYMKNKTLLSFFLKKVSKPGLWLSWYSATQACLSAWVQSLEPQIAGAVIHMISQYCRSWGSSKNFSAMDC